jgi:membrane protease YdiL (CAAX protease family)
MLRTAFGVIRRRPVLCFFAIAYALAGLALAVIGLPHLSGRSHQAGSTSALAVFPVMVVGVGLAGVGLTAATGGRPALRELWARGRRPVRHRWYLVVLVPPISILAVLGLLRVFVSPKFTPQLFLFGIAAGVFAGFCEEFGWTGFAYPRMSSRLGALRGALLLGLLWGLWHFPVVDSLGAASPHGHYFLEFFGAFVAMLVALRVLIAWLYTNTGSIRLAQSLHASSTGFLVVLGAGGVSAGQEALWYAGYAAALWLVVGVVVALYGPSLAVRRRAASANQREAATATITT